MQFVRHITTTVVILLSGALALGYAKQDQHNDRHGQRSQGPSQKEHARGRQMQDREHRRPENQSQRERAQRQPEQRSQQARQQRQQRRHQAVEWQQQRGWLKQGGWRGNSTWQQNRAQRWENEHRSWAQRGGYGGYHIPQSAFRVHFGRQHWFRIHSRPTIYMGYPRFIYGGYSFLLLDPWPEYWDENWYDTDDVYIDYDDGYYLYDRRHPNVRLAITVVLP